MFAKLLEFIRKIIIIGARNPRDLRYIFGVANSVANDLLVPAADTRALPHVNVLDICEGSQRWMVQSFPSVGASVSPLECSALAALSNLVRARRIFEFGTYKGVSTTQLALNVGAEGVVFTLDLPEDHPAYALPIPRPEERAIAAEGEKGILIPADLRSRIKFLQSDSAVFDETPYLESIDLVFVDGAHSYDYVKNDSEKGIRMLRRGGVIAWHDCVPNHPDVVKYIRGSGLDAKLVSGTAIAFALKD